MNQKLENKKVLKISIIGTLLLLLAACSDPMEKPAKPKQIEKFKTVLDMYPEIKKDYLQAESDGVVTKGELMAILEKVKVIKSERDSK